MFSYNLSRAIAAIVLAASLPACVRATLDVGGAPTVRQETTVEVDNQAWSDIVVYAVDGNKPWRLGIVGSHRSEKLRLPAALRYMSGPLQLVARPIAGKAFPIPAVVVSAGQRVAVTLLNQSSLSSVAVWDR